MNRDAPAEAEISRRKMGIQVTSSNAVWKKTMATDHTDGDPPSRGSTIFVNMGWMPKRRAAERNNVAVKTATWVRPAAIFCEAPELARPRAVIVFLRLEELRLILSRSRLSFG
jgi:hypothetical protein